MRHAYNIESLPLVLKMTIILLNHSTSFPYLNSFVGKHFEWKIEQKTAIQIFTTLSVIWVSQSYIPIYCVRLFVCLFDFYLFEEEKNWHCPILKMCKQPNVTNVIFICTRYACVLPHDHSHAHSKSTFAQSLLSHRKRS